MASWRPVGTIRTSRMRCRGCRVSKASTIRGAENSGIVTGTSTVSIGSVMLASPAMVIAS